MKKLCFPDRITVEVTNCCNVSCTFCNRQKIDMELGYMEEGLFYKIIDEASMHLPIKLVPFFRGEPLMHPKISTFLSYAKRKGIGPIQLASNALLLGEDMQNQLLDAEVDFISFSLDTLDSELYKKTRIHGDLDVCVENVVRFSEKCNARKKAGLSAPLLQVSTINLPEYLSQKKHFIDFWRKYVDVVRVYEQHDEYGKLVDVGLRKKIGIYDRRPCRKVFTDMLIYWNGDLALCNYDWDEKRKLGNVRRISLEDAWNSLEYENVRDMHLRGEFDDGICRQCHHWKIDYLPNGYMGESYKRIDRKP